MAAALALSATAACLLNFFHVGFQASDDTHYVNAALGWLTHFPYVGDSHWTLRHTIALPTAAFIGVFGLHEWSVSLSNVAYFLAFLLLNAGFAWRYFGLRCAVLATALALMAPGFTVVATYLNPDIPELFFFSASFWALLLALEHPAATRRWLLLGLVAGLGYINRQTSLAVVLFVSGLCLVAPQAPRRQYLLAGLAFAATVSLEWLFLTLNTGDLAYRMRVDFNHDPVDRFAEAARVAASGGWIDKEGNISVNVFVDPLLNVLFTQKYGLLFWLALPAAVRAHRQRQHDPAARRIGLLLSLGLVSFFFVAANPKLYLVPRYFVPAAWAASLAGAWWLVQSWAGGRRILAAALLGATAIVAAAAYSIENTDPRATERLLVRWVQAHPGQIIHTDIETNERAAFFFRFAGVNASAVSTAKPPPGAYFFHSAVRQRQCAATARCRHRAADFVPRPDWKVVERLAGPRRPVARTVLALRLKHHLPPDVQQRLLAPVAEVTIFQSR